MTTSADLHDRRNAAVPRGVFNVTSVYAKEALNAEIWSEDGRRYIDFATGIGVLNVGHRHPRVIEAVRAQLDQFTHACFHVTPYESYVRLAERLNELAPIAGPAKTMFVTTGAEAVENAVKVARAFSNRPAVISFSGAFHGRTLLAMSLTGKTAPYKKGFGPFPADIYNVPFPNSYYGVTPQMSLQAMRDLFKHVVDPARVGAVIIEPVQGEGGINIAPFDFLRSLRSLCDEFGILLIADEVQAGFARTGRLFALEHAGVKADIVTMAKGLGGGFPLSAVSGRADIVEAAGVGGLGGTYAGNPIACAAALAVLDVIDDENLCARADQIGAIILDHLNRVSSGACSQHIGDIRGLGAMCAVELVTDQESKKPAAELTAALIKSAVQRGLILLPCGTNSNVIRFLAPLTASNEIVNEGMSIFDDCLRAVAEKEAA